MLWYSCCILTLAMLNLLLGSTPFGNSYKISVRVPIISMYLQAEGENGVDPDKLASDQDLHCFQNRIHKS